MSISFQKLVSSSVSANRSVVASICACRAAIFSSFAAFTSSCAFWFFVSSSCRCRWRRSPSSLISVGPVQWELSYTGGPRDPKIPVTVQGLRRRGQQTPGTPYPVRAVPHCGLPGEALVGAVPHRRHLRGRSPPLVPYPVGAVPHQLCPMTLSNRRPAGVGLELAEAQVDELAVN